MERTETTTKEKLMAIAEAVRFLAMISEPMVHPLQVPAIKKIIGEMEGIRDQ